MKLTQYTYTFLLLFLSMTLAACSGSDEAPDQYTEPAPVEAVPEGSLVDQVQFLVNADRFEDALDLLRHEDLDDTQIKAMVRDTHLLYANWLMHHAESIHMTERMPKALAHFRRVLELDPDNSKAKADLQQIEEIYRSMGRDIPQGVAE